MTWKGAKKECFSSFLLENVIARSSYLEAWLGFCFGSLLSNCYHFCIKMQKGLTITVNRKVTSCWYRVLKKFRKGSKTVQKVFQNRSESVPKPFRFRAQFTPNTKLVRREAIFRSSLEILLLVVRVGINSSIQRSLVRKLPVELLEQKCVFTTTSYYNVGCQLTVTVNKAAKKIVPLAS